MQEKLRRLAQDRLIWFVVLGAVLFAADRGLEARQDNVIEISLPLVEKLVAQWEGQTKRRPNARELDALIEGYIREEILVREAKRLGMDDDDVIIRRRLAQKVEFMMADDVVDALPDKAALQAFFNDNRAAYDAPESLSWRHVFTDSEAEALSLMRKLNRNDENWRQEGRPFMLNRDYAQQTEIELSRLMGTEFAAALFDLPPGRWAGPVASAYGWHVVKLDARQEAKAADFDRMVERVARDWQQAQRQNAMAAAWQDLRRQYEIELLPVDAADSRP